MTSFFEDVPFTNGRAADMQREQPAQPQAAAASAGPGDVSPLYDVLRSVGTGLRTGAEMVPGMVGDMGRLIEKGSEAIARPIFGDEQVDAVKAERERTGGSNTVDRFFRQNAPTFADVRKQTEKVMGPGYEPQTTAGKYAKTVGEFVPGALAGGAGSMSALGRSIIGQGVVPGVASEAAGQATEGTAAEPWARALGGLTGGVAGGMATLERTPRTQMQGRRQLVLDAQENQGIQLPEYMMPDAPAAKQAASRVADIPFLGTPVQNASRRAADDMGARVDELSRQIGNPDMANATGTSYDVLRDFQTTTSRNLKTDVYDAVDNLITNPTLTTPLSNTRRVGLALRQEMQRSATDTSEPALRVVAEAVNRPGGLTYQGLKELRTQVGHMISGKITPEPGTSQPALKRLYATLTDDLENAVFRSGGQPALDAWRHANQVTRTIERVSEQVAKVVGAKGQMTPEQTMNSIIRLASSNDPSVANRLNMLRISFDEVADDVTRQAARGTPRMHPGTWDDVGAAILNQLGRNPRNADDIFDPKYFVTQYSRMSRQGREILFGDDMADALDDLAVLARQHVDLTNPSKFGIPTNIAGGALGVGAFAAGGWPAVLGGIVTTNVMARLLSRPASAQKLATWARAREGVRTSGPASLHQASQALAQEISNESGQDAEDVMKKLLRGGNG